MANKLQVGPTAFLLIFSFPKTYLYHKSYPRSFTSSLRSAFMDYQPDRFLRATRFFVFSFCLTFRFFAVR